MQQQISLRLLPEEANDDALIKKAIAITVGKPLQSVSGFQILKKSLDARAKTIWVNLTVLAFISEPYNPHKASEINFHDVRFSPDRVVIIGAGPAGLFAALKCLEHGVKPIILERGKDVRSRRRDLAILNREGLVNSESNYCFGEGGAGTYSDGKLYTRSNKRGSVERVLQMLVKFGADDKILYEAHPHIGTNKLPHIITSMRQAIIDFGGEIFFEEKVVDLKIANGILKAVVSAQGNTHEADAFIFATGHSARDIFKLFHSKKILIEAKPFALGVRVEHPQALIDACQYRAVDPGGQRPEYLPPASYSLVQQVNGRGVFSFCMCPGGIIAPAATDPGELVVNGWSPSKRNNPYANSGMVVQVSLKDAVETMNSPRWQLNDEQKIDADDPLLLMSFQQMVEQKAFKAGGGNFVAPAQRMEDFANGKLSTTLPDNSYLPGLASAKLEPVLPPFIYQSLKEGFKVFGEKLRSAKRRPGFFTNDAVVVATESRTSSPVRIPRNEHTLEHPQIKNLYPCGEGGGYAGGIVSAAMDGERVADIIIARLSASG